MKIAIAVDSFKTGISSIKVENAAKEGSESCDAKVMVKPLAVEQTVLADK